MGCKQLLQVFSCHAVVYWFLFGLGIPATLTFRSLRFLVLLASLRMALFAYGFRLFLNNLKE